MRARPRRLLRVERDGCALVQERSQEGRGKTGHAQWHSQKQGCQNLKEAFLLQDFAPALAQQLIKQVVVKTESIERRLNEAEKGLGVPSVDIFRALRLSHYRWPFEDKNI